MKDKYTGQGGSYSVDPETGERTLANATKPPKKKQPATPLAAASKPVKENSSNG